jgi:hypothetical protein
MPGCIPTYQLFGCNKSSPFQRFHLTPVNGSSTLVNIINTRSAKGVALDDDEAHQPLCLDCNGKNSACSTNAMPTGLACTGKDGQTWLVKPLSKTGGNPEIMLFSPGTHPGGLRITAFGNTSGTPVYVGTGNSFPDPSAVFSTWIFDNSTGLLRSKGAPSLCMDTGSPEVVNTDCAHGEIAHLPFCNTALDSETRAQDLVQRMTNFEKVSLLTVDNRMSLGVPRLGVPTMPYGEALHGVCAHICGQASDSASTGCATSFPHALHTAGSFNRSLFSLIGKTIGLEARSLANQLTDAPLHAFAPNIQVGLDPR